MPKQIKCGAECKMIKMSNKREMSQGMHKMLNGEMMSDKKMDNKKSDKK